MQKKIESARNRIREIDLDLVALVAERVRLARIVGEVKRSQKKPTVDYSQERVVFERAREAAAEAGLDPRVAEDLMARLIRASVTVQEEDSLRFSRTGEGKVAVVVGGAGRMGRWLGGFLGAQGYRVGALDPAASPRENEWARGRVPTADLVICSAPPGAIADIYETWCAGPPAGVVADIASVKTPLVEAIRNLQAAGGRVASMHPMFGPSIALLRDAEVVICETGDEEATSAVEALFRPTTARLVRLPLADHDRIMADLLSLAHATAIAFALSLPDQGHPVRSTTFQALERLAGEMVRESPEVFYEIQTGNPHSSTAIDRMLASLERIRTTVGSLAFEDFRKILEEGQRRTAKPE